MQVLIYNGMYETKKADNGRWGVSSMQGLFSSFSVNLTPLRELFFWVLKSLKTSMKDNIITHKRNNVKYSLYTTLVQKLPFRTSQVQRHEHEKNNWNDSMSKPATVMNVIEGYMHINNFLSSTLTPLVHCSPFLTHRAKSPLQENTTCRVTIQRLHTSATATRVSHRRFPTRQKELDELLWTVIWLWEERKDFILNDKMLL